ncbi:MAG: aspartate--tRNA ligase [Thermoleophilia bacterium]|nr:aspartate--tRNA ligase [Thermoleophilia bacterium]
MSAWRDLGCGEPRAGHEGRTVTLAGWAARRRDHGGLVFIDLRDETGVTQLVVNPERAAAAAAVAHGVRNEYVLQATGTVVRRSPETVNPRMATGDVELQVDDLLVLSTCTPLPFQLDEENVDEALRQRYRWIDLRRDYMQRNIRVRAQLVRIIREEMERERFVDIETPILWKPTPEGARDFVVPARLQRGKFYALPQSPQIAKQLLVTSGFERYYQIARCFRDEDPRADRLQELTQLDVEMAFPDREYLFELMERIVQRIWRECIGVELEPPFQRMSYDEAMLRFGIDRPDLRFGMEIQEATAVTRGAEFGVFANAPCVRYIAVPKELSRAELEALTTQARSWGAKGLAYVVFRSDGELSSSFQRFLSDEWQQRWREPGHTLLFVADEPRVVAKVLGLLRLRLGRELSLIDESRWEFLWVVDMAAAEYDDETGTWHAAHHPFTRPTDETLELFGTDPGAARAVAYDLVGNGLELAGGSFRIHEPELQQKVFEYLGIGPEEQEEKFGFLLEALRMGAPPHGGIASGIDRLLMALLGEARIRDTQAFPKNQVGLDYMTGAPIELPPEQLAELGILVADQEGDGARRRPIDASYLAGSGDRPLALEEESDG